MFGRRRFRNRADRALVGLGSALCFVWASSAPAALETLALVDLSLEELTNLQITSVSRQPEPLAGAAASIFVITNDDIRRSGANTLPEALRLAPNLHVARNGSAGYAISARGFNNGLGNKLLVLIDGRTVYAPLNSGVFWDQQDVMLEDVERIEVVSGAGGVAWGTNAVNGVINVITRKAYATQGTLVSAGGGDSETVGAFRHGGKAGDRGHYRVYGKRYRQNDDHGSKLDTQYYDWDRSQGGVRFDWDDGTDGFTVQSDFYQAESERLQQGALDRRSVSGLNILGRWDHRFADGQNLRLQAYYDQADRDDPTAVGLSDTLRIFDFEMQHGIPIGAHSLLWGAGYRTAEDKTTPSLLVSFVPEDKDLHWINYFAQIKLALSESVELTAGTRFERNSYSKWESLPSLRLAWTVAPSHVVWGAISRTIRAPSRIDKDFFLTIPGVDPPLIAGGPAFRPEEAVVSEIGYRAQPTQDFSFSVTAFHHDYEYLRSGHEPVLFVSPALIDNEMQGRVQGVEAWATYQATPSWRLSAGLTTLSEHFSLDRGSDDPDGARDLGNNPNKQWMLRSSWDISPQLEFDVYMRHVGKLSDPVDVNHDAVDAYTAVDARIAWKPQRDLELSLQVRNLFDPGHVEFGRGGVDASSYEVDRSVFAKLLWKM